MSRIFELLNKSKGEVADLVRPLVDEQTRWTPPTDGESDSNEVPAAAPAAPAAKEAPAAEPHPLAHIRTLSLRIPAPSPLLPFENGQWRPNEQYRILRTKISRHPKQPRVIVISSPASGDGKSVTAINTAGALSLKSGAEVLLLDADLRKPVMHKQLGLPQSPGLADVLAGTCTLEEALVHTREFPNLYAITSGTTSVNPVELLDSRQWRDLCARLRTMFRYVIIDSPPVGAVADYALIQDACDGVILVVRPDYTNRDLCRQSLGLVPKAKFLGVLLNCVPDWAPLGQGGADYYYYGGKGYANDQNGSGRLRLDVGDGPKVHVRQEGAAGTPSGSLERRLGPCCFFLQGLLRQAQRTCGHTRSPERSAIQGDDKSTHRGEIRGTAASESQPDSRPQEYSVSKRALRPQ